MSKTEIIPEVDPRNAMKHKSHHPDDILEAAAVKTSYERTTTRISGIRTTEITYNTKMTTQRKKNDPLLKIVFIIKFLCKKINSQPYIIQLNTNYQ